MSGIRRFFVEKKKGLDYEAKELLVDIHESLGIKGVKELRILYRYDIEGVSDAHLLAAKGTIISEPPIENVYIDSFPIDGYEHCFVTEYLPGQFDQCSDSLIQCFQIISGENTATNAVCAKVFALKGELTEAELNKIMSYCHNPVDSRIGSMGKPNTLKMAFETPANVKIIEGFTLKSDNELAEMKAAEGCAMTVADLICCRDYFKNEEMREPTVTEIKVIDTYWSDHCRHTTFLTELEEIVIEDGPFSPPIKEAYSRYLAERHALYGDACGKRPVTLMDMAVMGMKSLKAKGFLEDLDESDEVNACSIEIDVDIDGVSERWLLMFKNETHNHPTEIEPFGGAATCLGGAIRDPLSGRAYVYHAMRITGSGDPRKPMSETLEGKLPQKIITTGAASGYSSYGNQIGVATGHVREIYDEGFVAKRMEIGAVIGAAPKNNVVRERLVRGDLIIIVGGRTGRDGCGGATGSSKEHSANSLAECGAEVQKGNAPAERKLQRLFRNEKAARLIKKCNDFGAGGICVAIGELAPSLKINLDSVLRKYEGLDGTELAISESQERMAVAVSKNNAELFISLAKEENLEAVIAAEVTDDGRMRMSWRGEEIVSLKRSFLDLNGAKQKAKAVIKAPENPCIMRPDNCYGNIKEAFASVLADLNACSQKGLVERFDSTIGAGTVLMPFGGKRQLTPEDVMAAKIPVTHGNTDTVSVMSAAYDPDFFKKSPFHGGVYSVVESVARLVAAGCDYKRIRTSFQEYFEKMAGDYSWGKPAAALLGALSAQLALTVPAIGGKDSMSGTFLNLNVPPVLVSFGVSVTSVKNVKSAALLGNSRLYIIKPEYDMYGIIDFEGLKQKYEWFYNNLDNIKAAASVKKYGIAETASKMCFGNDVGIEFDNRYINKNGISHLFSPLYGAIVFESGLLLDEENAELIGKTNETGKILIGETEICVNELISEWEKPLEKIFPAGTSAKNTAFTLKKHIAAPLDINNNKEAEAAGNSTFLEHRIICKKWNCYIGGVYKSQYAKKPLVFIPVFPGTNCEYDSERAFLEAGAAVETLVFRNTERNDIKDCIERMVECIKRAQIIMIPGGFSAGDEPNGSAKFIAAVFRNPYIAEAVNEHIKSKDGLILGICNGFQALIKLGLLPNGEITEITEKSPTIYYNEIGRHISQIVDTKVVSCKSPFLSGYKPGEILKVPVSHGEGRFLADACVLDALNTQGQIATVYVNESGNETALRPFNPNGSMYAVEGLISPDGRVFGRMGHPERASAGTFINVPGEYDTRLFESAVSYYMV